jgi:hypothetical protein
MYFRLEEALASLFHDRQRILEDAESFFRLAGTPQNVCDECEKISRPPIRLIVPKSKTEAGTGRVIPFTRRLCVTLSSWIARFPDVDPESYIFPHHRVACRGGLSRYHVYETDLRRPIGSWKRAWKVRM